MMGGGKGRGSGGVESMLRVGSGSMRRECGKELAHDFFQYQHTNTKPPKLLRYATRYNFRYQFIL